MLRAGPTLRLLRQTPLLKKLQLGLLVLAVALLGAGVFLQTRILHEVSTGLTYPEWNELETLLDRSDRGEAEEERVDELIARIPIQYQAGGEVAVTGGEIDIDNNRPIPVEIEDISTYRPLPVTIE